MLDEERWWIAGDEVSPDAVPSAERNYWLRMGWVEEVADGTSAGPEETSGNGGSLGALELAAARHLAAAGGGREGPGWTKDGKPTLDAMRDALRIAGHPAAAAALNAKARDAAWAEATAG